MLCHSEILELLPNQYWKYPLSFFFSDKKRNMNLDVGLDNCLSEAYANNFHPSGKMAVLWGKRKQYLQKIKCDLGFVKLPNWLHQKATAFCSSCHSKSILARGKTFLVSMIRLKSASNLLQSLPSIMGTGRNYDAFKISIRPRISFSLQIPSIPISSVNC